MSATRQLRQPDSRTLECKHWDRDYHRVFHRAEQLLGMRGSLSPSSHHGCLLAIFIREAARLQVNPGIHWRLLRSPELMERSAMLCARRHDSAGQTAGRRDELRGRAAGASPAANASRESGLPVCSPGDQLVTVSRHDLECLVEHVSNQDRGLHRDLCCPDARERQREALMPTDKDRQA